MYAQAGANSKRNGRAGGRQCRDGPRESLASNDDQALEVHFNKIWEIPVSEISFLRTGPRLVENQQPTYDSAPQRKPGDVSNPH